MTDNEIATVYDSGLRRNIDITAIDQMSINELAALPPEALADLQDGVDRELAAARKRQMILDQALDTRYATAVSDARHREEKESGIIRIADGDYTVAADAKRAVYWDQSYLGELKDRMVAAGDDPDKYITTKIDMTVSEVIYRNWPQEIRNEFLPARTVKPGKQSYKIERKKAQGV